MEACGLTSDIVLRQLGRTDGLRQSSASPSHHSTTGRAETDQHMQLCPSSLSRPAQTSPGDLRRPGRRGVTTSAGHSGEGGQGRPVPCRMQSGSEAADDTVSRPPGASSCHARLHGGRSGHEDGTGTVTGTGEDAPLLSGAGRRGSPIAAVGRIGRGREEVMVSQGAV